MRPAKLFLVPLVALTLLKLGCGPLGSSGKTGPSYRTAAVERGNLLSTVSATGTLNAVTTVQVGSQLSGIVYKLYADFNSQVKAGMLLAEIDPATFQASVDQAKADVMAAEAAVRTVTTDLQSLSAAIDVATAEVANSEAAVRRAEVLLQDRERTLRRTQGLATKKFASDQDLDTAQANRNTAAADVDSAKAALGVSLARKATALANRSGGETKLETSRAQLAQKKANLELAQVNLSRTKIYSPIDGVVVSRNVDVGQTVAASFQAPVLFSIANDLKQMQIDANVDEADIGRVKLDQRVDFTVDAYPDEKFRGKVVQIRLQPIVSQNVVTYDTVVQVANDEMLLRPGMTANIYVQVARADRVLKIPNAALSFVPPATSAEGGGRRRGAGGSPGASADASPRTSGTPEAGASGRERGQGRFDRERGEGGGRSRGEGRRGEGRRRERGEGRDDDRADPGGRNRKTLRTVHRVNGQTLEPLEIQTGISDGSCTEVVSGDLKEDDRVAIGFESQDSSASSSQSAVTNPFAPRRGPGGGGGGGGRH